MDFLSSIIVTILFPILFANLYITALELIERKRVGIVTAGISGVIFFALIINLGLVD